MSGRVPAVGFAPFYVFRALHFVLAAARSHDAFTLLQAPLPNGNSSPEDV